MGMWTAKERDSFLSVRVESRRLAVRQFWAIAGTRDIT